MKKTEDLPQARNLNSSDLEYIAELHKNCFADSISLFSSLSNDIIKCYYAHVLEEPKSYAAVLEEPISGRIVGLAFGTTRPGFQRRFLRQHFFQFCWSILKGLFISAIVWKLLSRRLRKNTSPSLGEYGSALADAGVPAPKGTEALFILVGVHKQWRGKGNAERLVKYFATQMFEAGAKRIRGAISSDNLASLILHKRLGWKFKKISDTEVSVWIDRPDFSS